MDLSVSPDLPAWLCYGIVFLLGIFVAAGQVTKRLGGMDGAWLVSGTWLLLLAYMAVPVVLFWLLDRTSAISDTSLFAAVLIGVGYQRIIAGDNQAIRVPGDVSSIWTPFLAYADKIAKRVLDRGADRQLQLAEKLVSEVMGTAGRYQALETLALARSADTAAVQAALTQIDQAPGRGDADKQERKARYLYGLLLSVPDIHAVLKDKGIVSSKFYWTQFRRVPEIGLLLAIVLVIVGVLVVFFSAYYRDYREVTARYHVWRLSKSNSTTADQYRSRRQLVRLMREQPTLQPKVDDQLLYLVQKPGLAMERIDLILQTLMESQSQRTQRELPRKLVQALRAASPDARSRVHDVLVFLSSTCPTPPDPSLKDWKANERDSSTLLEDRIGQWDHFLSQVCK